MQADGEVRVAGAGVGNVGEHAVALHVAIVDGRLGRLALLRGGGDAVLEGEAEGERVVELDAAVAAHLYARHLDRGVGVAFAEAGVADARRAQASGDPLAGLGAVQHRLGVRRERRAVDLIDGASGHWRQSTRSGWFPRTPMVTPIER